MNEVRQQMIRAEQQLDQLTERNRQRRDREHDGREGPDHERRQHAERLEHLHIAAEHLDHAGLHEIARDVRGQAEALERDLHGHERDHEDELHHMLREMREHMEALTREVESLRGEVNRMRRN
jgi:hypothetical protein